MTNPSPVAILKTVLASLDAMLLPGLQANLAKATPETESAEKLNLSTALTMGHLLRLVLSRLEQDEPLLRAEHELLKPVLADLCAYLSDHRDSAADEWLHAFNAINQESSVIADTVGVMRLQLHHALEWLQKKRPVLGKDPDYLRLRGDIRRCIAFQIENESKLIDAAMSGRGHRR